MIKNNLKAISKRSSKFWIGLVASTLIMCYFFYQRRKHDKAVIAYITYPKVGDLYDVKLDDNNFSLNLVQQTTKDSVFLAMNLYEISKHAQLNQLNTPENFAADSLFGFSKKDVHDLYVSGYIMDVKRDK